jgi:hypothetical protein
MQLNADQPFGLLRTKLVCRLTAVILPRLCVQMAFYAGTQQNHETKFANLFTSRQQSLQLRT